MVVFDFDHPLSLFTTFPFFYTYFLTFVQLLDDFGTMIFVNSLAMLVFHLIHISAGRYPSFISIKIYLRCFSISYYLCVSSKRTPNPFIHIDGSNTGSFAFPVHGKNFKDKPMIFPIWTFALRCSYLRFAVFTACQHVSRIYYSRERFYDAL